MKLGVFYDPHHWALVSRFLTPQHSYFFGAVRYEEGNGSPNRPLEPKVLL